MVLFLRTYLRRRTEGPMEPVGDVDGHPGPAQLLECFGVQNQEEGAPVLERSNQKRYLKPIRFKRGRGKKEDKPCVN